MCVDDSFWAPFWHTRPCLLLDVQELTQKDIERPDDSSSSTDKNDNNDDDNDNAKGDVVDKHVEEEDYEKVNNPVGIDDDDGEKEDMESRAKENLTFDDSHAEAHDDVDRAKTNVACNDGDIEEGLLSESCVVDAKGGEIDENIAAEETGISNEGEIMDIEEGTIPLDTVKESHGETMAIHATETGETELATTGGTIQDDVSDMGSSDGEMMEVISFNGDDDGLVSIPMAGECRHDVLPEHVKGTQRKEPNGCAICLCPFEISDKVTWSSNPSCQHVFHEECIKDWLMASGRKFLKRQRREQRRTGNLSYDSDPVSKITGFPMLCPCCRQPFIIPEEDEESVDEKAPAPEANETEMGDTEAMMVAAS